MEECPVATKPGLKGSADLEALYLRVELKASSDAIFMDFSRNHQYEPLLKRKMLKEAGTDR
jgi:hypothetical protein